MKKLVVVTPELVEEPVPTGSTSDDGDTNYMSPRVWQAALRDSLSMKEEVVPGVDCCDSVDRPLQSWIVLVGSWILLGVSPSE